MFAFIALFIVPVVLMIIRRKTYSVTERDTFGLLAEYAVTVLETDFFALFLVRYILLRSPFDVNSFSSVQFFLKYCLVSVAVVGILGCFEKYLIEHISKDMFLNLKDSFVSRLGKLSSVIYSQNEKTFGKRKYHIDEIFFIVFNSILAVLFVARCFFGVEITDEAYYVADAYSVYQGNLPFAFNTSNAAGMNLVSLPFVWVFRLFSSDNEGIFLYMRLCFALFKLLIIALIYIVFRKKYSRRALLPACALLIAWTGYLYNFSYNTSSFWLTLLSCSIIWGYYKSDKKKGFLFIFLSGALSALAVFSHPMHVGSVLALCGLILFCSDNNRKLKNFVSYVAGGITQVTVVLLTIAAQTGINRLINGLNTMLFHRLEYAKVDVIQRFIDLFLWLKPFYIKLFIIAFGSLVICSIINYIFKLEWKLKYRWLLSAALAYIFLAFRYDWNGSSYTLSYIGALTFWLIIFVIPFCKDIVAVFLTIPYLLFFLFEIIFPGTGSASGRVYFMYPTIFVSIVLLLTEAEKSFDIDAKSKGRCLKVLSVFAVIVTATVVIHSEYSYIYRDDPISQLNYQVTSGIYKGIFTSRDNAECTIEVEEYIKDNSEIDELVSFRDNVPFGYIMSNGIMCDIRTWDAMQYSYIDKGAVEDNPTNMFRYYKNIGRIPDKYIYVDYGRDEIVSYDSPTFKFNEWLNTYYDEIDDVKINERYSARIYIYNGSFDGDYDYWIDKFSE